MPPPLNYRMMDSSDEEDGNIGGSITDSLVNNKGDTAHITDLVERNQQYTEETEVRNDMEPDNSNVTMVTIKNKHVEQPWTGSWPYLVDTQRDDWTFMGICGYAAFGNSWNVQLAWTNGETAFVPVTDYMCVRSHGMLDVLGWKLWKRKVNGRQEYIQREMRKNWIYRMHHLSSKIFRNPAIMAPQVTQPYVLRAPYRLNLCGRHWHIHFMSALQKTPEYHDMMSVVSVDVVAQDTEDTHGDEGIGDDERGVTNV